MKREERPGPAELGAREREDREVPYRETERQGPHDTIVTRGAPGADSESLLEPLRALDTPELRYREISRIGLGGMGEVCATFDAKLGREIARKTLISHDPAELPVLQARFVREAKVQALLEHPAIVPVYDIGVGADGRPYFTMKRIRGETLFSVIEALREGRRATLKRVGRHRLLSAFVTLCLAVDYAHQHGVIHRDLKPENIMLGPHGEVYILDWGLARMVPPQGTAQPPDVRGFDSGTRPGEMVGTPGFMPPEQVIGQHDEVDARSDVYALGAILYEILTLRGLHEGGDITAIIESTLNASRVPPPVAPELHAIATRATRFHKDQRYYSARALADAIERYLDGDRDEELRRRLAEERADEARKHANLALDGPLDRREAARSAAMREAGRALALAPQHEGAAAVILRLFATPPDTAPAPAAAEAARLEHQHLLRALKDNVWRTGTWLALFPLLLFMGPRMPLAVATTGGRIVLHLLLSLYMARTGRAPGELKLVAFAVAAAFVASLSLVFGPFMIVPGFASAATSLYVVQASPRFRTPVVVLGCAAIVAPFLLEVIGLLAPSMRFDAAGVTLLPRMTDMPREITLPSLLVVSVVSVVLPSTLALRLRDALLRAEERLVVQKWQLAQLIPPGLGRDG